MKPHMRTDLASDVLRMEWPRRHAEPALLFHGDRGSEYCTYVLRDAPEA